MQNKIKLFIQYHYQWQCICHNFFIQINNSRIMSVKRRIFRHIHIIGLSFSILIREDSKFIFWGVSFHRVGGLFRNNLGGVKLFNRTVKSDCLLLLSFLHFWGEFDHVIFVDLRANGLRNKSYIYLVSSYWLIPCQTNILHNTDLSHENTQFTLNDILFYGPSGHIGISVYEFLIGSHIRLPVYLQQERTLDKECNKIICTGV